MKIGVLKNFTKFTGKPLCQNLFFNKILKKETLAQVFSCEFCEFFKNTFLTKRLRTTAFIITKLFNLPVWLWLPTKLNEILFYFNPLSANTKNGQTLKTICRQQPTNCLSVVDYFVSLTLIGLIFTVFKIIKIYCHKSIPISNSQKYLDVWRGKLRH